jgi:hypothetical protein
VPPQQRISDGTMVDEQARLDDVELGDGDAIVEGVADLIIFVPGPVGDASQREMAAKRGCFALCRLAGKEMADIERP